MNRWVALMAACLFPLAGNAQKPAPAPPTGIRIDGDTPGSFDAAFVSQVLLRQLDYSLIRAEVAQWTKVAHELRIEPQ